MGCIDSYYSFCYSGSDCDSNVYTLERIEKWGNHTLFNNVFEYHDSSKVNYYDSPSIENYLLYSIEGQPDRSRSFKVLFEMSPVSYPYGIVRSEKLNEVVLFKMKEERVFEVYVMKHDVSNVMNCLQLLIDGHLEAEIDLIKEIIDYEG